MILARVASLMPGRECSARSTVPMETPTVSTISLIPADFASADWSRGTGAAVAVTSPAGSGVPSGDSALERLGRRVFPRGGLRLSFEDFTGRY